ncbi:MAG: transposase [Planctomycetota bacterium]
MSGRSRSYGQKLLTKIKCLFRTFLKVPGVEPTNNAMEQRMRFVAIDRKITQGTRGERGRRWCERIWTVLATCVQRGRSAFQFLYQSIVAYFSGHTPPSLLAMPP